MTSLVTLLFVTVALATLVSAGSQFYTTLHLSQDVTLERGTQNFNYLKYLIVGTHPNYPLKRSLLQFQQLNVANCDTVVGAYLKLYFVYAHKASFMTATQVPYIPRTVVAHQVYKSWTESQATSTKRFTSIYWSSPWLGLGSDAAYSATGSGVTIGPSSPPGWYQIDVTSAVKNWKNGQANHGLLIRATNENTEGRDFRFTSNADLGNPGRRAQISVVCQSNSGGSTGGGGGGGAGGGIGPVGEIPAI